jgi:hypothetical protein
MRSRWITLVSGLVFVFGISLGFGYLGHVITTDFSGQVALGCLTFIGGIWIAVYNVRKSREKDAESRIFAQKAEVYESLVNILRDIFMANKGWSAPFDPGETGKALMIIRYKMIVWGGQDTVRAIAAFEQVPDSEIGQRFLAIANLYAAIRRDLGHQDDARFAEDLFLTQIVAGDKEEVRGLLREARRQGN